MADETTTTTTTDNSAEIKAAQERATKAEAALKARDEKDKKEADAKKAADQAAADKLAIEQGQSKTVLEQQAAALKLANESKEKLEAETLKRIDAKIAKLPKLSQDKIATLRGSLPIDKLWDFVELEAEGSISGTNTPGGSPGGKPTGGMSKISAEGTAAVKAQGYSTEMVEKMTLETSPLGAAVRILPVQTLIDELKSRSPYMPVLNKENADKRRG